MANRPRALKKILRSHWSSLVIAPIQTQTNTTSKQHPMTSLCQLDEGLLVVKQTYAELEGEPKWENKMFSGLLDDPKICLFGFCCPCVLAGQISQHRGNNCIASCCCSFCCQPCHMLCFAIPDRHKQGHTTYLEDCCVLGSCPCCAQIQLAKEVSLGAPSVSSLKEEVKSSAKQAQAEAKSGGPAAAEEMQR